MELRTLRAFVEVVRQGGFSQAAKTVFATQSTVSKAVKHLEDEIGVPLLDHARPDSVLAVVAAARLDDDRLDPLRLEDPRERQPRRPGADDADLRSHSSSASTRWKTWNAWFAAGTPQ